MNNLADLVTSKSEDLNIQINHSILVTQEESEWIKHKNFINTLPTDYKGMLLDRLNKNPDSVTKKYGEKRICILIFYPEYSSKYKTWLEIIEQKNEGVKSASYITTNWDTHTSYARDVFDIKFQ